MRFAVYTDETIWSYERRAVVEDTRARRYFGHTDHDVAIIAPRQYAKGVGGGAGNRFNVRAYLVAAVPAIPRGRHFGQHDQSCPMLSRRFSQFQQPCGIFNLGTQQRLELNGGDAVGPNWWCDILALHRSVIL